MRTNGRTARAGTVLVALVLAAGCGGGGSSTPSGSTAAVSGSGSGYAQGSAAGTGGGGSTSASLPDALVGSWSGDDAQGVGSWTIQFAPDGSYRQANARRGVEIEGQALASGSRLSLQTRTGESRTVTWQVSGGTLSLDGTTYLKVGGGGGGSSSASDGSELVGTWIGETNTYQTLVYSSDGTYQLDNGTGQVKQGNFAVSGNRVQMNAGTYTWSVKGQQLTLVLANGHVMTFTRIS